MTGAGSGGFTLPGPGRRGQGEIPVPEGAGSRAARPAERYPAGHPGKLWAEHSFLPPAHVSGERAQTPAPGNSPFSLCAQLRVSRARQAPRRGRSSASPRLDDRSWAGFGRSAGTGQSPDHGYFRFLLISGQPGSPGICTQSGAPRICMPWFTVYRHALVQCAWTSRFVPRFQIRL